MGRKMKILNDKLMKLHPRKQKRNLKKEIESLLIATQNNAIKNFYIKAEIDKTQQNNECRLCGEKDETVNLVINGCSN